MSTEEPEDKEVVAESPEVITEEPTEEKAQKPGTVSEPAKVMRIGSMIKQLLAEVKATELDEPGRDRLAEIYETSIAELADALSEDLQAELRRLALPFDDEAGVPTGAELRIAQAQLVGWLEGLFHGIQATLFAQQAAAQRQLQQITQGQEPMVQATDDGGGVYL